jgi:histidinol-phosphate aminotransferase
MRVGYVVAHADTIQKLQKRQPWANNSVSQVAAAAAIGALEDSAFLAHSLDKNKEALQVTTDYLTQKKVRWIPSHANLLYFSLDQFPADFLKQMEARQVIVREIKEPDGRWCRVSMGTPDDMRLFCKRLGQLEG